MPEEKEWERRERELAWEEGRYDRELRPWQRIIDNHWGFCLVIIILQPIGFIIGVGIGLLL